MRWHCASFICGLAKTAVQRQKKLLDITVRRLAFVADFGTRNFNLKNKFDMENKTSTNHENSNDANRLLCEVLSCVSKKAETPKEKYNQLKKDFENLTTDAEKMMQITIKHALKQSALVGGYSGFSKDFWIGVMSEHLA